MKRIGKTSTGYKVCKKCGEYYALRIGESPNTLSKCECGGDLKYIGEYNENIKAGTRKLKSSNRILRISGIIIGASIMLLPYYYSSPYPLSVSFFLTNINSFILWAVGGLTAAFIAGGKLTDGLSNGFYSAFVSGLVVIIIFYTIISNYFISPSISDNIALFGILMIFYILLPALLGIMGGFIGIIGRISLNVIVIRIRGKISSS